MTYRRRLLPPARIARLEAERLARQQESAQRRARRKHFLYFLACEGYVKIGYARDPGERCRASQVGNPFLVRLVGVALGGEREERILHRALRALHVRAEWFRLAPPLDQMVAKVAELGEPLAARAWIGEWLLSFNGSTELLIDEGSAQKQAQGHRIAFASDEICMTEQ